MLKDMGQKNMSRPEKSIDWDLVDQLLMAGCTGTEIAPHFDMHYETFYLRVQQKYAMGFTEYSSIKRSQGDSALKSKQFEKANNGSDTMLIWLGKCRLLQRDSDQLESSPKEEDIELKKNYYASQYEVQQLKKELDDLKSKTNPELQRSDSQI